MSIDSGFNNTNMTKVISGDELSENQNNEINKRIFSGDGTGGPPDRKEDMKKESKLNVNFNKSHTDNANTFNIKFNKKNAIGEDNVYPKIEILGNNNKIETNLTKNDFQKSRISGMKLSIMSFDTREPVGNSQLNRFGNSSSGNVNKYLSPDSTRLSASGEISATDIIFEGYIYRSDENNHLKKYYTALVGNDLFYFSEEKYVNEFPNCFDEERIKLIKKTPTQEEIHDFIEVL